MSRDAASAAIPASGDCDETHRDTPTEKGAGRRPAPRRVSGRRQKLRIRAFWLSLMSGFCSRPKDLRAVTRTLWAVKT